MDLVNRNTGTVHTPHALPMYKTDLHRQHVSVRKDPVRSRIPERPPVSGPGNKMGSAGRLAKNKSFAQFVHQSKIDNAFRCMCSSAQLSTACRHTLSS